MGNYKIEGGFDMDAYKADVAKTMLPIMYRQLSENRSGFVSSVSQQAVEAAVEIAEMLERRLLQ